MGLVRQQPTNVSAPANVRRRPSCYDKHTLASWRKVMFAPATTEPTLILPPTMRTPKADAQQVGTPDPDEVILSIEGVHARLSVRLNDEAILGRIHHGNALQPQIDLVPFGGDSLGVSRL